MNKSIIAITLIVAGFIGLAIWKSPSSATVTSSTDTGAKSMLAVSETSYDFGTISMKDGHATKDFTVSNPTDEDILLSTLITSCMCTTAFIVTPDGATKGPFSMPGMGSYTPPANDLIKTGESRIIRVVYDPNAHGPAGVGPINRLVTLTDGSGAEVKLEIKAIVTP